MEYLCSALKRVRFCSTSRRRGCFSEAMISKINTPFGSSGLSVDLPQAERLSKKRKVS